MALHTNYLKELAKERAAFIKFKQTLKHKAEDSLISKNLKYTDPYLLEQEMYNLQNEYLATRTRELAHHQGNLRTEIKEAKANLERDRVKAESGYNIIARYAQENAISIADAETELNRYASRKTSGFDTNRTADQYAALIHKGSDKLVRIDHDTAHSIAKREMEKINYEVRKTEIQAAEQNAETNPQLEIQRQPTSGEVVANQLYGDM